MPGPDEAGLDCIPVDAVEPALGEGCPPLLGALDVEDSGGMEVEALAGGGEPAEATRSAQNCPVY